MLSHPRCSIDSQIAARSLPMVCALAMVYSMAGSAPAQSTPAQRPPNIVLILADDLGYGDLGCYGQKRLATPNIDRLAQQGMRLTQFYAGCTVCAPSRCVLMTGKHTGRCAIRGNSKESLSTDERVFTQDLSELGYRCGLIGKWGLGQAGSSGTPLNKGFHTFFGYLDQTHAHNFFPTFLDDHAGRWPLGNTVPGETETGAGVASIRRESAPDILLERALDFVRSQDSDPFFLFYSINLPHANNEAKQKGTQEFGFGQYADTSWPDAEKGFAHMVALLDTHVGRLVDAIDQMGLGDNTLILFSSDNGPHHEGGHNDRFFESSGAVRGSKRDLLEGGIRVPGIVRWTGRIEAGSVSDQLGAFDDVYPTLLELAGRPYDSLHAALPEGTGVSLLPTFLGKPSEQRQRPYLYWSFYESGMGQAVREGWWKAIEQPLGTSVRLYRLDRDLREQHDLAATEPETLARLTSHMRDAYRPGSEPWVLRAAPQKTPQ
ncbi:MAG: arylsulfatase [Pirellula sp.]